MTLKFTTIKSIDAGWSGDAKFRVTDASGRKMMLRVSGAKKRDLRRFCHEILTECTKMQLSVCSAVSLDFAEDGTSYTLVDFVDGVDAEAHIPTLDVQTQYRLGFDAGRILKSIHTIPAPPDALDWSVRYGQKIDRKLKMYAECPLKYENDAAILDYIAKNRHLLENLPQCAQHGDYHIGNMMVAHGELVVIDFDRCDFGEPWEEFNRIVWSAQASPAFASGNVDGYFGGEVPEKFWRLLALYIATNTLSSLPWALPFGDVEIATMRKQCAEMLEWYDGFKRVVPSWYRRP